MLKLLVIFATFCAFTFDSSVGISANIGANCITIPQTCDPDCKLQHGAASGKCGKLLDTNCYCAKPTKKGQLSPAGQCQPNSGKTKAEQLLTTGYKTLCDVDCKCNHGCASGTCDFKNRRCECGKKSKKSKCTFSVEAFKKLWETYNFPKELKW